MIRFNRIISLFGLFLIISGLIILLFIFTPVAYQELNFQTSQALKTPPQLIEDPQEAQRVQSSPELAFRPKFLIPVNFDFSLVIPKIDVNSPVFPNINSSDPDDYLPVLKKGVAHAQGSSLPDQPGVIFIFAHSTDSFYNLTHYNAAFFLLNKLVSEDEVIIFYQNKKYRYQVTDKKIVAPEDISQEIKNLTGNYLVLQTCYPPGTTLKRLLVIASPKSSF